MEHRPTIVELMSESMSKIRDLVDVNTVVGEPISTPDGVTIIPVSRVSFGFGAGGSDWGGKEKETKTSFGGGAGAGVNVVPVCFMIVSASGVRLVPVEPDSKSTLEKAIDLAPVVMDKLEEFLRKYTK